MKNENPNRKHLGPMEGLQEPPFKRDLETHLSFNPYQLDFHNPAQIMIFARILDNAIHTPSPHTTEQQLTTYKSFLEKAHTHTGDLPQLSQYFKDAFPSILPYLNIKEVLVNIIDDTAKAASNSPSQDELDAIIQIFEAIVAILSSATGLLQCIHSANRALKGVCNQWRGESAMTDQVISAALALKQNLLSE